MVERLWWDRSVDGIVAGKPAIRNEITVAVNRIDAAVSSSAHILGQPAPTSARLRFVVIPPVALLYRVSDEDRQVKIVAVKLWDD